MEIKLRLSHLILLIASILIYNSCIKKSEALLPTVSTLAVSQITSRSAQSGGNVSNDGGATVTGRGLVWGKNQNPSLESNEGFTSTGNGLGVFSDNISGLSPNLTYFVRAYATNEIGVAYGNEETFNSKSEMSSLLTIEVSNITSTTAMCGGNITSDGGARITSRGVCWSTTQNPTTANEKTIDGSGMGSYTSNLTNLIGNTKYFVWAYAINSMGVSYGNQQNFTTSPIIPMLTTNSITTITHTSAIGGGNITDDGGAAVTERGICWSTQQNPTISNYKTINGTGTGSFTSNITGLTGDKTYYVRAYAINSVGTGYGDQKTFKTPGAWSRKADFGGGKREGAVGFSIGTKGYIGLGYGGSLKDDFWEYNPSTDSWTQKAFFAGGSREWAVGFSIGTKGYVGVGTSNTGFWEYDPSTNTWTQKADVGGGSRNRAVGFSIGNKGYIGTGIYFIDVSHFICKQDFWEYDPSTNIWTRKTDCPGGVRYQAIGFSIGNKGYIGTGDDGNFTFKKDFWEYDPSTNTWTQKANFGGTPRFDAIGFSIGTKGYVGMGYDGTTFDDKSWWEYDQSLNRWSQKANFIGGTSTDHVGFSIGNKGYIGLGSYSANFWEYDPSWE